MLEAGDYVRVNTIGKGRVEGWVEEVRGEKVSVRPRGWACNITVQRQRVHAATPPQTGGRA